MDNVVTTREHLRSLYREKSSTLAVGKEVPAITPGYRALIEAAPFCVIATAGDGHVDASPRGDQPGFVKVIDAHTVELPDRRGNNRIDSLENLLIDPRVSLLFLLPGLGETVRIRGTAVISTDPERLAAHAVDGKQPATVLVITVNSIFFQCSRAIKRSGLWDANGHIDRRAAGLPSVGELAKEIGVFSQAEGQAYDDALEERMSRTLY